MDNKTSLKKRVYTVATAVLLFFLTILVSNLIMLKLFNLGVIKDVYLFGHLFSFSLGFAVSFLFGPALARLWWRIVYVENRHWRRKNIKK